MRKLIIIVLVILMLGNFVFAYEPEKVSDYKTKEYLFNPNTLKYTIDINIDKNTKKEYKKIDKLYEKQKYKEILEIKSDFLPAMYSLYIYNADKNNYNTAISILKNIQKKYPDFSPRAIQQKIIFNLYNSKQYDATINEIKENDPNSTYYNFILADSYFNMNEYEEALKYAKYVPSENPFYIDAQEIIFKCYYRENKLDKAYETAKNLIKNDTDNPKNYLRVYLCTSSIKEKLENLYIARNLTDDINAKWEINGIIILLEQTKINDCVKKSKKFIETPNWVDIITPVSSYGSDGYWVKRQDKFYTEANNCINKYTEGELSACFSSILSKQNTLNQQLIQQEQMNQENIYRETLLEQNERMIHLQQIQNINQTLMDNSLRQINSNLRQQNYNLQNINNSLMYLRY